MGQDNPFILHTMLATSALHLAYLQPALRQHCTITAAHHQDLAFRDFRSTVDKVEENNCLAVFVFCRLLM